MINFGYKTVHCQFIKGFFDYYTGYSSIMVNNDLCEIVWKKENIYKINKNIVKVFKSDGIDITEPSYIYLVEEARCYKQIINKNNLTLNSILTINEAIQCYGKITQACSSGIKNFVDNLDKVKSKYSIKEIIDLTKNQFGNQKFQDFFNNVNLIIEYEK